MMTDEDVKEWEKQLSKLRKDDDRGPRDLERRIDDLMAINKKHQEQMASLIKENQELKKELSELKIKTIDLVDEYQNKGQL
jgi:DNA repair ATPase RecN